MKDYDIYFELYGKKMKVTIAAFSEESAKGIIKGKIIFHKVEPVDKDFKKALDIIDDISDLLGIKKQWNKTKEIMKLLNFFRRLFGYEKLKFVTDTEISEMVLEYVNRASTEVPLKQLVEIIGTMPDIKDVKQTYCGRIVEVGQMNFRTIKFKRNKENNDYLLKVIV